MKCREATAEQKAVLQAHCQQCKGRGHARCLYPDGTPWQKDNGSASCAVCIKWNKRCGVPVRRAPNAKTRGFLQLAFTDRRQPEQSPHPLQDPAGSGLGENREGANRPDSDQQTRTIAFKHVAEPSSAPKRPKRKSATGTNTIRNEAEVATRSSEERNFVASPNNVMSVSQGDVVYGSSSKNVTATRQTVKKSNTVSPEQQAKLLNDARVSRSTSSKPKSTFVQSTAKRRHAIQENILTPGESAEEATDDVEMAVFPDDFDDAARQLLTEASGAAPPSPPATGSEAENMTPDMLSYPETTNKQQPRSYASNRANSRMRRSTTNYSVNYTQSWELSDDEPAEELSAYEGISAEEDEQSDEEDEAEASSADESLRGQGSDGEDLLSDMDIEPKRLPKTKKTPSSKINRKGLDFSLPPMHDNESIFADLTSRANDLGLAGALNDIGRSINVATMCSGTESPLFGLIASAAALEARNQSPLTFRHLFNAEIEPFKQAFIERNWAPELLFRDIREFIHEETTTATTAYGSVEQIPDGVDILVAGFSCKNLSRQNNHPKSLKENGESGETWTAVYEYSRRFRPSVVLLENVKSNKSTWDDVVSQWSDIGYQAGWIYCDTKRYYYPQTRERMYMIAIDRRESSEDAS